MKSRTVQEDTPRDRSLFAAKATHIPRMVLTEAPGPLHGCRDDATRGRLEIGQRLQASGADNVILLDMHWLSHAANDVNARDEFQGMFTSSEFPTQIDAMAYDHVGNPALANALAQTATARGAPHSAHARNTLGLVYGPLVLMHVMPLGRKVKAVSFSGWLTISTIDERRRVGAAVREAREKMPAHPRQRRRLRAPPRDQRRVPSPRATGRS